VKILLLARRTSQLLRQLGMTKVHSVVLVAGHCTAMLWKKSKALGCSKKNTWNGGRPLYVCRYAQSAANFGSKSEGVNMPEYSREPDCYKKYPISKRWENGQKPSGSGTLSSDFSDGEGEPTKGEPVEEEEEEGK